MLKRLKLLKELILQKNYEELSMEVNALKYSNEISDERFYMFGIRTQLINNRYDF